MSMARTWGVSVFCVAAACAGWGPCARDVNAEERQPIRAIYVPLADHYAGIVAYEKYRTRMQHAEYTIEKMRSWPLLRAYFMSGKADVAFIICPQAMDMFRERPDFRWVSLMHRDGNALAINDLLNLHVGLPEKRHDRQPDAKVADAFVKAKRALGEPTECGVPHLQATHTVVLYKYLKDQGRTLGLNQGRDKDVVAVEIPPPKSPAFIKKKDSRGVPASFEQSLPWADVVETKGFGHVAWYSKDVMPWPNGHVECIAIATDTCIAEKTEALREVITCIHKAGRDIENARRAGGAAMTAIVDMVRRHIPEHNREAIVQSLRPDLNVINYAHLNVDRAGLRQIMDLAVEGGILRGDIDIDAFADTRFSTEITEWDPPAVSAVIPGHAERITQKTKATLDAKVLLLRERASSPLLVNAVKEQNAKGMALTRIKAIDAEWVTGGREDLARELRTNAVGTFLRRELVADNPVHVEAFLCDREGAVVGEYPKTSDYWQGDEEKFTACYNKGNGKLFVGPLAFDSSTSSYSVHISAPVKDGTETIGVLVLGLANID